MEEKLSQSEGDGFRHGGDTMVVLFIYNKEEIWV